VEEMEGVWWRECCRKEGGMETVYGSSKCWSLPAEPNGCQREEDFHLHGNFITYSGKLQNIFKMFCFCCCRYITHHSIQM
jgi:hypothetical protein